MREDGAGEDPAGPGAGAAGLGARAGEAAGVVLKMHSGIADERGGRGVAQQPDESGVGRRPVAQHRLAAAQIGPERAVEAKDGTRGEAALPERVGVFEAVVVKLRAAHVLAVDMQRPPVQSGAGRREMRADWRQVVHLNGVFIPPAERESALGGRGGLREKCGDVPSPDDVPSSPPDAAAPGDGEIFVHEVGGWRRLALWPLAALLGAWARTLRLELNAESRANLERHGTEPVAFVLWHNRLFLAAEIFRRFRRRPVCALVSTSRDGAWLAAFFQLAGLRAVRGSSSKGGHGAARGLVASLRAGHDVGITPDGPRGPRYDFKPGAVVVARRAGAAVLLVGTRFGPAWRLRSWDGFYVPRPFSRVVVTCELVPSEGLAREDAVEMLATRLRAINPDGGERGADGRAV